MAILFVLLGASLQAEPLELSLESARRQALENHPTLAKLEAKLEEMRGRIDEVLSGGNPRLEIQAQYAFLTPQLGFSTPQGNLPIVVNNKARLRDAQQSVFAAEQAIQEAQWQLQLALGNPA